MGTSPLGALGNGLYALHRRLLPQSPSIGWTPYLWLFYLISFLWIYFTREIDPFEFSLAMASLVVFLVLYFNAYWHSGRRLMFNIAGILLLGVLWAPFNIGAMTFFIFAGAFAGMAARPGRAALLLGAIVAVVVLEWWLFDLHSVFLLFGTAVTILVGATNIYYAEVGRKSAALRLSQEEVRQLAAMAERERIARDLHDLLGHTLSVITIKSELAAKLSARGDSRAENEIREVEAISRDALRQVREAVVGFRRAGLVGELANARLACEAGGVNLTIERVEFELASEHEAVLAMVLREAITNILRHADADSCAIDLRLDGRFACLSVRDDGRGGEPIEGSGLSGMRERLQQVGGQLRLSTDDGFALHASVPVASESEASAAPAPQERPA